MGKKNLLHADHASRQLAYCVDQRHAHPARDCHQKNLLVLLKIGDRGKGRRPKFLNFYLPLKILE